MRRFYYIPLVFSMMALLAPLSAQSARQGKDVAVLVEGTVSRRGIPGFGPNALSGLYGRYAAGGAERSTAPFAEVWATGEALSFDKALWTPAEVNGVSALYNGTARGWKIWAFRKRISAIEGSGIPADWTFVVRFPDSLEDRDCRAFADELVRRVTAIFSTTRTRSDLSFPATLGVAGKPAS